MNPWKGPSTRKNSRSSISPAWVVALAAAAASGLLFLRLQDSERRLQQSRGWTTSVMDSLGRSFDNPPPIGREGRDSLYWQWVAISARLEARKFKNNLREVNERRGTLMDESDLAELREAGLKDPARQLRDSLLARPDVIPFKSELGGRQRFVPEEIVLLHRPYVFAYAEDGHTGGYLLLAYSAQPDRITWRRIWWAEQ
jgi:hypothetical protein